MQSVLELGEISDTTRSKPLLKVILIQKTFIKKKHFCNIFNSNEDME